jgi:ribosomal protein RSM22 (predicted rRNA methylase)
MMRSARGWLSPIVSTTTKSGLPQDLQRTLDDALRRFPPRDLDTAAARLSAQYRAGHPNVVRSELDAAAYAAARMPATYAAAASALRALVHQAPEFVPGTLIDLGGGTGAVAWAASTLWPSLRQITIVEQQSEVIAFGRSLSENAVSASLRDANWQRADLSQTAIPPGADLITMSYLLAELPEPAWDRAIARAAAVAAAIVIVEPGTPPGFERIRTARKRLLDLGFSIAAPCPHAGMCPIEADEDWCHFAARVNRTALHRRLKGGTLGFEDEKFSYVGAVRGKAQPAANRVLRHPQKRKGVVSLRLCRHDGTLADTMVSQRERDSYRAARDVAWGDVWPPAREEKEKGRAE